jgi:hypothetical protein
VGWSHGFSTEVNEMTSEERIEIYRRSDEIFADLVREPKVREMLDKASPKEEPAKRRVTPTTDWMTGDPQ